MRDQWLKTGHDAVLAEDGRSVFIPALRTFELVVRDEHELRSRTLEVRALIRNSGCPDVHVLMPVGILGRAHEELYGMPVSLVGWIEQECVPRFVSPERA